MNNAVTSRISAPYSCCRSKPPISASPLARAPSQATSCPLRAECLYHSLPVAPVERVEPLSEPSSPGLTRGSTPLLTAWMAGSSPAMTKGAAGRDEGGNDQQGRIDQGTTESGRVRGDRPQRQPDHRIGRDDPPPPRDRLQRTEDRRPRRRCDAHDRARATNRPRPDRRQGPPPRQDARPAPRLHWRARQPANLRPPARRPAYRRGP